MQIRLVFWEHRLLNKSRRLTLETLFPTSEWLDIVIPLFLESLFKVLFEGPTIFGSTSYLTSAPQAFVSLITPLPPSVLPLGIPSLTSRVFSS